MAFAHSFPIDGTKPQDDDTISNKYPDPFRPDGGRQLWRMRKHMRSCGQPVVLAVTLWCWAPSVNFQKVVQSVRQRASAG